MIKFCASSRYLSVLSLGLFSLGLLLTANISPATAEDDRQNPKKPSSLQHGTLELEVEAKKEDPYSFTQDKALKLVEQVLAQTKSASTSGVVTSIPEADAGTANYLAAGFLYCSIKLGTCQFYLDSLLELAVINSRVAKKASCPTLEAFWRAWLASHMEERHNYQVKTSFINLVSEFRSKQRPRYVKCLPTVQGEIDGANDDKTFFTKRYEGTDSPVSGIEKTIAFLKELKEKEANVFLAVGIKREEAATAKK